MTDIAKLRELLTRVESATGPDRELDYAIHDIYMGEWLRANGYVRRCDGDGYVADTPPFKGVARCCGPEQFTASLDAAVALCERVLPGWRIRWQHDGDGVNHAFVENKGDFGAICAMETESFCATAGLAVCATIIRAQIAMIEKELV